MAYQGAITYIVTTEIGMSPTGSIPVGTLLNKESIPQDSRYVRFEIEQLGGPADGFVEGDVISVSFSEVDQKMQAYHWPQAEQSEADTEE